MSKSDDEIERLMRIRDQQVRARDPYKKQKKSQQKVTTRAKSKRQQVTGKTIARDMVGLFSNRWKGALIGAGVGIVVLIIITLIWTTWVAALIGLAITLVTTIAGLIIGSLFDWRDEVNDI